MLKTFIGITCVFALFGMKLQSEIDPNWRQIVPGRTTRAEVEELLGPSRESYSASYNVKEGNIFIAYSTGLCGPEKNGGWNVPKNTVVAVTFNPKEKRSIAELRLEKKRLRKVVDKHVLGITYYVNDRNSITYEVQKGKVEAITYEPPMKLYCGDSDLLRRRNGT
jgi:hypothetical protein